MTQQTTNIDIYLSPKSDTPEVFASSETNSISIIGRSFPEDAISFYQSLIFFLEKQLKSESANKAFTIDFKLEYFNTSSGKQIIDILFLVKKFKDYQVNFHYHPQDEDMLETAKELAEISEVQIHFKEWLD